MKHKHLFIFIVIFAGAVVWMLASFASCLNDSRANLFDGDVAAFHAHWNMDRVQEYNFSYYGNGNALFLGADYVVAAAYVGSRQDIIGIGNVDMRNIPREYREYRVASFEVLTIYRQNNPHFVIAVGDVIDVVDVHGTNFPQNGDLLLFLQYIVPITWDNDSTVFYLANATQSLYFYDTLNTVNADNSLTITWEDLRRVE